MCHSGPLSFLFLSPFFQERLQFLIFTSLSSRISTIFTLNSSSQFLPTIFSLISTDLQRSSQVYLAFQPLLFIAIFYLAPSPQDLHKSSTDLSKIFQNLPSSIPFYQVPGQSVIPAHSPVFHRSSQIFTDLSCHSPPIYPFLFTHHSISKIFTDLLQIFYRSFKDLSKISLPSSPFTKTWTVGHSGPLFRSPSLSFPPLLI